MPGDYDGDGRAEIGVFRPSDGNWHIMGVHNHTVTSLQWGTSGDVPVLGDFDGDGKADFGVWRPSVGTWYVLTNPGSNPLIVQLGTRGDLPVPGDYDGDGKTDPAIFRPGNATWHIRQSSDGALVTRQWGVQQIGSRPRITMATARPTWLCGDPRRAISTFSRVRMDNSDERWVASPI